MPSMRSEVPPFEVMTVLDRVARLRASGRDVISLCAGEPAGGAPSDVNRAAAELHAAGTPFGYTPALGIAPLREALAGHYRRWYGLDVDPRRFAITTGSSGGFLLAFLAAFDHGDAVALARPGYPAYRNILSSLGCRVVDLDCGPEVRFQPTVEQVAAEHARSPLRGLILASPANPTGTMVTRDELAALTAWCAEHDVLLVSDEIYHGVTYAGSRGVSALEFGDGALVVSSFSKYWGMTGWRLGWLVLPPGLVEAVDALAGNLALCPPAPAQHAALEAFTQASYAECDAALEGFAEARRLLLGAHDRLGWGVAAPADGAFYYYADLGPQLDRYADSSAYAAALLDATGVALTPGTDFDAANGHRTVRISFAAGPGAIAEAIERILDFQG
ncbi:aspartate aminotransferase [Tessaracoccus aquimaris]|uniref:Aminotransferase n=1 Tax=Tessaracoccus aquimaris TaxID=1332264 RepID=A0A1Q2CJI1_9ACTN|nr:aminotransferase class I/II-fold pyridoxal phosphate-dependent enzyme [Tessaracoccus aquimaris]AQP46289.1 aspartate aminotransferase [Tessaracoccus aquimaris]